MRSNVVPECSAYFFAWICRSDLRLYGTFLPGGPVIGRTLEGMMAFRAKKLRVQLPCGVEGSLVELDDQLVENQVGTYVCTCSLTNIDWCQCSVRPVMLLAGGLVEPELLPLLRKQLENRLAEIDLVAEMTKKQLQARLSDIDVAEQTLRDRREPGDGQ